MNPQIRYTDPIYNPNGVKFSYDKMRTIDPINFLSRPNDSSKFSSQIPKHQIATNQPILIKHKSNNIDNQFYQEANFTESYRIQSNSYSAFTNQDNTSQKSNYLTNIDHNSIYKSTNYVKNREQINKFETANDFFKVAAEQIINEDKFGKQIRNTQDVIKHSQKIPESSPSFEQETKNIKIQQINDQKYQPTSDECKNCEQIKKQKERMIAFMRQQLEIGAKQFTDRMNKIIVQQAREIKDLRKSLINNQKLLINFSKNRQNPQNWKAQRNFSPGRGLIKQRSPSKLSLTKSSTSVSTNNASRQKITMVSKQLSPSKKSLNNNSKKPQKQQIISHQKLSSTFHTLNQYALNSQEIQMKIKTLEQYIQALYKIEHERNQKTFLLNNKVQILEKGVIKLFGSRTQHLKTFLNQWVNMQQDRLKQLYQEMRVISSRVGSMANNQLNLTLKKISSTNLKNTQNSWHSTPSIMMNPKLKDASSQFNLNKISIKLKNFSSEIDQLKQITTNLQTKEFKYDNFQIENLKELISQVYSEIRRLDKAREKISGKLIENEQKLQRMIDMSKYSHMGSHTEIYPSSSSQNQYQKDNQMKKISKGSIMRNNSVEISYLHNNYMKETGIKTNDGTKSIKSEIRGKYEKGSCDQQILPKFMNMMGNKKNTLFEGHLHSQFNGFVGEESGFSQYIDESVYNNQGIEMERKYREESYENEESFGGSQETENEQEQKEEQQGDFFYRVDLSTHDDITQNGQNYQTINQNRIEYHATQIPSSTQNNHRNDIQRNRAFQNDAPTSTINRFMEVIEYRQNKPLKIQIDQTGYIKSADNGMYIVDRNMDGFDLSRGQLQWLSQNGIIIMEK